MLILGLVWLGAFFPVVVGSRSFFSFDLFYEQLPIWHEVQADLRAGKSPFWLDGLFMGSPLLFTQEAPLFYPLTTPLLLTGGEVHRLADVFSLFHLWLAGVTAFALLWRLTSSWPASLFGGVGWMLAARTVQAVMWPRSVAVTALVPALALGLIALGESGRRAGIATVSVSLGLILLASRPHSLLGAGLALVAVGIVSIWRSRESAGKLLLSLALAFALGAPALLPMIALFPESDRFGGLAPDARDEGALSLKELDQVFLPVDGLRRWTEPASYPGVVAGLLFLVGLGLARNPAFRDWRWLYAGLAAAALVAFAFAWGRDGPYGLVSWLPLLRGFRTPVRYLASMSLAVVVGASLVVAVLERSSARGRRLAWLATALLAADLTVHTSRAAPTVSTATHRVEPALATHLKSLPPDALGFPARFWSLGAFTPLHLLSDAERVEALRDDPLAYALGQRFDLLGVEGAGPPMRRAHRFLASRSLRVAELGGARTLILRNRMAGLEPVAGAGAASKRVFPYSFPGALPRAVVVPSARALSPEDALAAVLSSGFDPRREVVLDDVPPGPGSRWDVSLATVKLLLRGPSELELETTAPGPGFLVLFDTWSPGWKATVDGRPTDVLRADYCFRAVPVERGSHRIRFRHVPPGMREGALLFLTGVLGLVLVARMRGRADAAAASEGVAFSSATSAKDSQA